LHAAWLMAASTVARCIWVELLLCSRVSLVLESESGWLHQICSGDVDRWAGGWVGQGERTNAPTPASVTSAVVVHVR
jgi:hypothetical protein